LEKIVEQFTKFKAYNDVSTVKQYYHARKSGINTTYAHKAKDVIDEPYLCKSMHVCTQGTVCFLSY
jgi:hypothetical protein